MFRLRVFLVKGFGVLRLDSGFKGYNCLGVVR